MLKSSLSLATCSGRYGSQAFSSKSLPKSFRQALDFKGTVANVPKGTLPLAKLVATIGPASENVPAINHVVGAGVSIMRINFSHATYEEADLRTKNLNGFHGGLHANAGPDANGKFTNMRAVMLDTQGPEIRTGSFGGGVKEVDIVAGQDITLTNDDKLKKDQTSSTIWISYKGLARTVQKDSIVLLDDGALQVQVKEVLANGDIRCVAVNGGSLGNKKGVNMPGLVVDLPAMSTKDEQDFAWGVENDIDCIAASFIRKAEDVQQIRAWWQKALAGRKDRTMPLIISKIESTEGLLNFEDILRVSDGIMVARGDLGVEIPLETLYLVQRDIIAACNRAGKPVINATQQLESMIKNPRPTRAEVCDVAGAVTMGADATMLSGESAKGKYPVDAVAMMRRVQVQTELNSDAGYGAMPNFSVTTASSPAAETVLQRLIRDQQAYTFNEALAVAGSAARESSQLGGIVVHLPSDPAASVGYPHYVPHFLAALRPKCPVFVTVPTYKQGRMLQYLRAVYPILNKGDVSVQATVQSIAQRTGIEGKKFKVISLNANKKLEVKDV